MIQTGQGSSQNQSALELGPWPAGMNNRQAPYSLPEGAVADALNGDFDTLGRFSRRAGFERVAPMQRAHSAFSARGAAYMVDGHELIQWVPGGRQFLAQVSGEPMSFVEHNGVVYWTDGVSTGRIVDGVAKSWGVTAPGDTFWLTSDDTSSHPGDVTVAVSFLRADGVESGLSPAKQHRSAPGAAITVGSLPLTDDPDVTHVNIYAGNGEAMYLEQIVPVGTQIVSFALKGEGKPAEQRRLDPPPPGSDLVLFKGRIFIAAGKFVFYTDPFRPEHADLMGGYIPFESDVELMAPVEDGLYVAAGATTFFWGTDPDKFEAQTVLNYGAVPGTRVKVPNTAQTMWMSVRGAVIGDREGKAGNVQEANVSPGVAATGRGAAMIRERRGLRQFVAVSPLAAHNTFARTR